MSEFRLPIIRSTLVIGAVALCSAFATTAATAATTTPGQMAISATVVAGCTLAAPANLTLTGQSVLTDGAGLGSISVECTNGSPYHIEVDGGGSGNVAARVATGGATGATLAYGLFRDAGYTENWGVTDSTDTFDGVGQGGTTPIATPVYMRITPAALQAAQADTYTDTVNVTVSY